jgi:hypothetical protein
MQPKSGSVPRLAGLTGLAFLIITLGAAAIEGNVPSADSSPSSVVRYFTAHRTHVEVATVFLGVALVFALFAFGAIRAHLSNQSRGEWLATVGFYSRSPAPPNLVSTMPWRATRTTSLRLRRKRSTWRRTPASSSPPSLSGRPAPRSGLPS